MPRTKSALKELPIPPCPICGGKCVELEYCKYITCEGCAYRQPSLAAHRQVVAAMKLWKHRATIKVFANEYVKEYGITPTTRNIAKAIQAEEG